MNSRILSFFYIVLFLASSVSAQTIEEAKIACRNGENERAIEIYSRLLKARPRDANLNLLNGICLYETKDYAASEKCLNIASKQNLPDSFFYLGQIEYVTYRFEESVENLTKYIQNPKCNMALKIKAEKTLSFAQAALRMIRGVEKVQIIDSLVVNKNDFMNHYRLSPEVGVLKSYMSYFHQKSDVMTTVYQNQKNDKIYFAEKTLANGTDIFFRTRLLDAWGDKVALTENVNSPANENFPFVLSDGVTLYFCSDRMGSMGGFDIFVTRFNLENESYLAPDNVGMPFNSIYNDYLLAIDEQNNVGWFASDRYQPQGKVVIYLFIPNADKKLVENESAQRLTQLATIHAIRETWENGVDYSPILQKIKSIEVDSTHISSEQAGNFRFVVDDQSLYQSLDQFQSEEAIFAFLEVLKMTDQIKADKLKLENLRKDYSASPADKKMELKDLILSLEKEIDEFVANKFDMEQKVRTLEKSIH